MCECEPGRLVQVVHRAQRLLDEVRDGLGVGLGTEDVALGQQIVAQFGVILDDPVVDHHEVAGAISVRVGVLVVGAAMCRPAGVADAGATLCFERRHPTLQILQLAGGLAHEQLAGGRDDGDAGGVITTILNALQSPQQDRRRVLGANISYDATHSVGNVLSCLAAERAFPRRSPGGFPRALVRETATSLEAPR